MLRKPARLSARSSLELPAPGEPVWLFDMDNTLHNADTHIFPHMSRSMTAYVEEHLQLCTEEARLLQTQYWKRYGATMLGLVRHHGTDPHHFLHHTHQFPDLARMVVYERALATRLRRLPGRKILFSNAPRAYVAAILDLIGLDKAFDRRFAIEDFGLIPKPRSEAYRRVLHALRVPARRCIMVEDTAENLRTAKRLGMKTVWITRSLARPAYVDIKLSSTLDIARAL
jgi:putative hydrolase of the HAD superfamily